MNQENQTFSQLFEEAINQDFSGWDFSYLRDLQDAEPLNWDYHQRVMAFIRDHRPGSLLDMDTGGGEILSSFAQLPPKTIATEGWEPNYEVAKNRLEPLGVKVVFHDPDKELPFEDHFFDLVINRHAQYKPDEVNRILRPGGRFISQQVGSQNDVDLAALLEIDVVSSRYEIDDYTGSLKQKGFSMISVEECFPKCTFFDIRAIIFYLKIITWAIPGFSFDRHQHRLRKVFDRIQDEGSVSISNHRVIIEATKTKE